MRTSTTRELNDAVVENVIDPVVVFEIEE